MYKTTQDLGDYLKRVASHATKPSRRGIIKDIPAWAKEPEEYYNSLLEQFELLTTRLHETRERVIWLKKQLRSKLPFETYTRIKHELEHAGPLLSDIEQETGHLRALTRLAAHNAWGAVFYHLAEQRLDTVVFRELDIATKELLQREHQELAPGTTERSEESRKARRKKDHRSEKRRKVRNALERGEYKPFVPHAGRWHAR